MTRRRRFSLPHTLSMVALFALMAVVWLLPGQALGAYSAGSDLYQYDNLTAGSLQSQMDADINGRGLTGYSSAIKLEISGGLNDADYAFIKSQLTSLKELDIAGVTSRFPSLAFEGCSFQAVRLPANAILSERMFQSCRALTTLWIGNNPRVDGLVDLTGIHSLDAVGFQFNFCESITMVHLPANVILPNGPFGDCISLHTLWVGNNPRVDNVVDLTGVGGYIGEGHFFRCSSITAVHITEDFPLGNGTFFTCKALTTLWVGENPRVDGVIDFTGFRGDAYGDGQFFRSGAVAVRMAESINPVLLYMFLESTSLKAVAFPFASAPSIRDKAFELNDGTPLAAALVPDPSAGGYQLSSFTDHFTKVYALAMFTQHPQSLTISPGQAAAFSVAVTGEPTRTLQWQSSSDGVSWTNIPGATSTTLSLSNVPASSNQMQYRCLVDNHVTQTPLDLAVSHAATLTVLSAQPSQTGQTVTPLPQAGESTPEPTQRPRPVSPLPQTGDSTPIGLLLLLEGFTLCALVGLLLHMRKIRKAQKR